MDHDATTVTVCALTYRRPRLLERLLDGLAEMASPGGEVDTRILIIDNDPTASARSIVEAHRARSPWPIEYAVEPERGIPAARNRAVQLTRNADFLVFIDDDERPDTNWLRELIAVQRRTGADAVMGRVDPEFEVEPPRWVRAGRFFERRRFPDGSEMNFGTTSNALVAAHVFPTDRDAFDRSLTLSGGSDLRFFREVRLAGHRIVWADDAVVTEVFSPSRVTIRWLVLRQYRRGINRSTDLRLLGASFTRVAKRVGLGFAQIGYGVAMLAVGLFRGRVTFVKGCERIAYGTGLLAGLLGIHYEEYRTIHGS